MTDPLRRLIDPRLGVIRRVTRHPALPELPPGFVAYLAEVSDSAQFGPWQADPYGVGAALGDDAQARRAAIGEAVERYCGNLLPAGLRRASHRDLVAAGEPAVSPDDFVLYSAAQYAQPGFPFVRFTEDLPVRWTEARDLVTGERALIPASMVWVNYCRGRYSAEPRTNFPRYSGIATGRTRQDAERAALQELVERDATTIWWHSGAPAAGIDLTEASRLSADLVTLPDSAALRYHLIQIPTVFDVPVLGALLADDERHIVTFGTACRAQPNEAARKALAEAMHLYAISRSLLDPPPENSRSCAGAARLPYRPDRAYLDSVRPDFRDVTDLILHLQLYLDPRMHRHVERIVRPPRMVRLGDLPGIPEDPRTTYLERLSTQGFRAFAADITTSDVRSAGLEVVRVVVPGLQESAPAGLPFLGGTRLYHEPAAQGWLPAPRAEDELIKVPMPYC